jgi:hypothetical protein
VRRVRDANPDYVIANDQGGLFRSGAITHCLPILRWACSTPKLTTAATRSSSRSSPT